MAIILGILIPLIGTTLGSALMFFVKKDLNDNINKLMIGSSVGVMLAASLFSLLIPSINMSNESFLPASIGFVLGFVFLIVIDELTKRINTSKNINMLMFSVTLHNIPEGMAVGVAFAGVLSQISNISLIEALTLSIGIAIQNIPEGFIISMPLKINGNRRFKSFLYGFFSGVVEPIFSIITIILINVVVPLLPYLLSFASGAMIYVIFDELVPQLHNKKSLFGIIGILIGFVLMMILDVAL